MDLKNFENSSVIGVNFDSWKSGEEYWGSSGIWEKGLSIFYKESDKWLRIIAGGFTSATVSEYKGIDYDSFTDKELKEFIASNEGTIEWVMMGKLSYWFED